MFNLKYQLHHLPYSYFFNEWKFDDNCTNNDDTITYIFNYFQSIRWELDDDFILKLEVKTTTDATDKTDATESSIFDNDLNNELDDDFIQF